MSSGQDINNDPMQLEDNPVRDSIQRVLRLATEARAPQETTWSMYGPLYAAQRQITWTSDENPDPQAYAE